MAADGSTAQILASGSQDLAALAGLFATEGVERNALAGHLGYGAVISAGISILGILGLVKSSVKLSIGLDRCRKSGFTIDSLRGFFGYEPHETPVVGRMVRCDLVEYHFGKDVVTFSKIPRFFDTDTRPIVNVASQDRVGFEHKTAIIGKNWNHETTFLQNSWFVAFATFLGTGITAWLLLIVRADSSWELWCATAGLHVSLLVLVGVPLWYSFQLVKPSKNLSESKVRALLGDSSMSYGSPERLAFMQIHVNKGFANFFHGSIALVDSLFFKASMLSFSALCAVSYVCQYTVLKSADNVHAAAWIGAQGALALFRVIFWMWDPSFDDPNVNNSDYTDVDNDYSGRLTPIAFARNVPPEKSKPIPRWAWDYLQSHSITAIARQAIEEDAEVVYRTAKQIFILGMDPKVIFAGLHRDPALKFDWGIDWRILLHRSPNGEVHPIIYVGRLHQGGILGDSDIDFWTPLEQDLGVEAKNKRVRVAGGGGYDVPPYSHPITFLQREWSGVGDLSFFRNQNQRFYQRTFKVDSEPEVSTALSNFAKDMYSLRETTGSHYDERVENRSSAHVDHVVKELLNGRDPLSQRIKNSINNTIAGTLPDLQASAMVAVSIPLWATLDVFIASKEASVRTYNAIIRGSIRGKHKKKDPENPC
ncbi:MAG: hypothetical protein M1831_005175 [Alyxoria varia]|nr:MAG: hypothetical protein M1831_005175 [Alyxoria varia]